MNRLETKHYAVIGAMLIAVGTQISGMEHGWRDALTTQFIGGLVIQVGTTISAMYIGAPQEKV